MIQKMSTLQKIRTIKQDIETLGDLHHYLRVAMEIELATIPVYLSALYALKPDTNQPVRDIIRSVVMEEMLHLTLVANVLNATGGQSKLNDPEFVPDYPTELPDSDIDEPDGDPFLVPLQGFSRAAIKTFMRIEQPEKALTPPDVTGWHTIGQFYRGLIKGLDDLCAKLGTDKVFTGQLDHQITESDYYGAAGHVIVIDTADPDKAHQLAKDAFEEIIDQGEGVDHRVFEQDTLPGKHGKVELVPAHYFRFQQIDLEQYYQEGDTPDHPTGRPLPVDWDDVFDMTENPKMADYPKGSPHHQALLDFNRLYMELLDMLQLCFTGQRDKLMEAVGVMYKLRYAAEALMKIPSGKDNGKSVGPSFEYV